MSPNKTPIQSSLQTIRKSDNAINFNNKDNNNKTNAIGQGGEGGKKTIFSPFGSLSPSFIDGDIKEVVKK